MRANNLMNIDVNATNKKISKTDNMTSALAAIIYFNLGVACWPPHLGQLKSIQLS